MTIFLYLNFEEEMRNSFTFSINISIVPGVQMFSASHSTKNLI
jgi:precorrin-4 methylase